MIKIDRFDRQILEELQKDARISNVELAERIGLSPTPCQRRVRALQDAGVIRGWHIDIDRKAVGLGFTVYVGVKVARHYDGASTKFLKKVCTWPEIVTCQVLSGDIDCLLEVVVADPDAYQAFLYNRLLQEPIVTDVRSSFAIRVFKRSGLLPIPLQ